MWQVHTGAQLLTGFLQMSENSKMSDPHTYEPIQLSFSPLHFFRLWIHSAYFLPYKSDARHVEIVSWTQFIVWPPLWFPTTVHHMSQHLHKHRNRLTLEEHVHVVNVQWNASIVFLCSTWGHVVATRSISERSRRRRLVHRPQVKSTMQRRKKFLFSQNI